MKVGCDASLSNKQAYAISILPRRKLRAVFKLKGSPSKGAMQGWAGPSILILLFVASTAYVVFGGVFELVTPPGSRAQTSMATVALESAKINDSATAKKISDRHAGKMK